MLSHTAVLATVAAIDDYLRAQLGSKAHYGEDEVYMSYLPLAHVFDR
jgi:long-subunit acyl-CoA synthetase (AMP-forming)